MIDIVKDKIEMILNLSLLFQYGVAVQLYFSWFYIIAVLTLAHQITFLINIFNVNIKKHRHCSVVIFSSNVNDILSGNVKLLNFICSNYIKVIF